MNMKIKTLESAVMELQVQQYLKNGGQIKSVPEGDMATNNVKKDKHFAKHRIFSIFKSDKDL